MRDEQDIDTIYYVATIRARCETIVKAKCYSVHSQFTLYSYAGTEISCRFANASANANAKPVGQA